MQRSCCCPGPGARRLMKPLSLILMLALFWSPSGAYAALNACDLNNDNVVNTADKDLAVAMALGQQPCTANVTGPGVCTVATVQRIVNAILGGPCVTDTRLVILNWVASVSSNVAGYNIYRSTTSGGPYTKLNTALVTSTTFTDTTVQPGQTYYYVARAVDSANNESANSNQASATIPPS